LTFKLIFTGICRTLKFIIQWLTHMICRSTCTSGVSAHYSVGPVLLQDLI